MDPVKVNYPVDVAAPKLMGSDGFCRDRVTVMEVEVEVEGKSCESNRELCSSLLLEKDVTNSMDPLDSTSLNKVPCPEHCRHTSHPPCLTGEDVSKHVRFGGANCPSWKHEELQVQRKAGQVLRSGSGSAKRPRMILLEDTSGLAVDGTREPSDKLGPHSTKCDPIEKTQGAKQRNNLGSKRGDRRNIKVSARTKNDSFSLKASLASFSSAASGNFFGSYGLKTDVHDITKLVDEISLNDLLQGTYECPNLGKDKGKKVASTSDGFLHSVRKACSLLQLPRSTQFQSFAELDSSSNEKLPTCQSSISIVGNGDNGDSSVTDTPSPNKDSCSKLGTPANLLDFSFEKPNYTLERLALPPPKDLESLLLDAAKPAVSSRNTPDPRPGKQISRKPSLPPFPWSHTFSGHCRNNSDAGKVLTNRTACQGRWVKIQANFSSLGTASNCLPNLESFAYDDSLVPSCGKKTASLENTVASSLFVTQCERGSSSTAASLTSLASLGNMFMKESGGDLKNGGIDEHCPRLLAAAQTLCDIATCRLGLNKDGMMKWPKKPSQKAMKARKSKSIEKHEDITSPSTSTLGSDQFVRNGVNHTSKKLKLSSSEQKKDLLHINSVRKGPVNWSATPKSSRSSPNKSVREASTNTLKQSCMMPPPAKVLNKTCNGQHKVRKLVRMTCNGQQVRKLMRVDWSQERDRRD